MSPRAARISRAKRTHKGGGKLLVWLTIFLFIAAAIFGIFFVFARRSWDGRTARTIVLVPANLDGKESAIYFLHFQPEQPVAQMIALPPTTPVKVIGGYGEYPLRSVYSLLTLEKKDSAFIRAAYSHALSEAVDEVWVADPALVTGQLDMKQVLHELIRFRIKGDLTFADRLTLYKWYWQLRPDQIKYLNEDQAGEWAKSFSAVRYPSHAKDCSITVINTTSVSGLGSAVGKILEESGFAVVRITDTKTPIKDTQLLAVDPEACASVVTHAQAVLPIQVPITTQPDAYQKHRAHIVIQIGEDLQNGLKTDK